MNGPEFDSVFRQGLALGFIAGAGTMLAVVLALLWWAR